MAEKMEVIRIRCPECNKKLGFPTTAVGRTAKCPGCSHTFRVPDSATPASPAAQAPPRPAPEPPASAATIKMHCPSCEKRLTFPATTVGRKAKCPGCEHIFVIEPPAGEPSQDLAAAPPEPDSAGTDDSAFHDDAEPSSLYDLASAEQSAEGAPLDIEAMAQAQAAAAAALTAARHDTKTGYPADSSFAKGAAAAGAGAISRATATVGPLAKGTLFATGAALLGAFIWYGIAKATNYELGIIAWALGGVVGYAMHFGMQRAESGLAGAIAAVLALGGVILGKVLYVAWVLLPSNAADAAESVKEQRQEIVSYYTDQALKKKGVEIKKLEDSAKYAKEYEKAEAEAEQKVKAMSRTEVKQEYERVQVAMKRDELVEHYTEKNLEEKKIDPDEATEEQTKQAEADAREKVDAMSPDEVKRESERIATAEAKETLKEIPTGLWVVFIALIFGFRGILFTIFAAATAYKLGSGGLSFGSD